MTVDDFIALFRGYWPQAKNVAASKQKLLWAEIIEGIPDDVIAYGLKRYARQEQFPPTVIKFERWLWPLMDAWAERNPVNYQASEWRRRRTAMLSQEQEDHEPPTTQECEGCLTHIRFEANTVPPKRFAGDGGLVFREGPDGRWYAARCPLCSGPEAFRKPYWSPTMADAPNALPVPNSRDWEAVLWLPVKSTPIAPAHHRAHLSPNALAALEAAEQDPPEEGKPRLPEPSRIKFKGFPNGSQREWFAWLRRAVENTRRVIEGLEPNPFAIIREREDAGEIEQEEVRSAEFSVVEPPRLEGPTAEDPAEDEPPF